jgi:hypothetical protein
MCYGQTHNQFKTGALEFQLSGGSAFLVAKRKRAFFFFLQNTNNYPTIRGPIRKTHLSHDSSADQR